jgi:CheY-like chemotaxis protein
VLRNGGGRLRGGIIDTEIKRALARGMQVRGAKILVVEDQYLIADEVCRLLKDWGVRIVGPASTIEAALDFLAHDRIDAAILDINMRGQKVYPAAEELRRQGIPFLFLSAYDSQAVRADFRDCVFLEKPFSEGRLCSALQSLIATDLPTPGSASRRSPVRDL